MQIKVVADDKETLQEVEMFYIKDMPSKLVLDGTAYWTYGSTADSYLMASTSDEIMLSKDLSTIYADA